jgi:hypothetical protein
MLRAPPEIKANSRSGMLLAALKASRAGLMPNWRPMTATRIRPRALSSAKSREICKEARAS